MGLLLYVISSATHTHKYSIFFPIHSFHVVFFFDFYIPLSSGRSFYLFEIFVHIFYDIFLFSSNSFSHFAVYVMKIFFFYMWLWILFWKFDDEYRRKNPNKENLLTHTDRTYIQQSIFFFSLIKYYNTFVYINKFYINQANMFPKGDFLCLYALSFEISLNST